MLGIGKAYVWEREWEREREREKGDFGLEKTNNNNIIMKVRNYFQN